MCYIGKCEIARCDALLRGECGGDARRLPGDEARAYQAERVDGVALAKTAPGAEQIVDILRDDLPVAHRERRVRPVVSAPADDILEVKPLADLIASDDEFRIDKTRHPRADLRSGIGRIYFSQPGVARIFATVAQLMRRISTSMRERSRTDRAFPVTIEADPQRASGLPSLPRLGNFGPCPLGGLMVSMFAQRKTVEIGEVTCL